MRSNRWNISLFACGLAVVLLVVLAAAGAVFGQTQAQTKQGTVEHIKVHGKSLEGNLEKDSPDRDVFIYLPPDYATNTTKRYPVVYLLHGYGLTAERWMPFTKMAEASDKNIAAGTMKGMILVNPDAYTIYNGSMYSSSVTIGDWESFIADDLVSYVDSHYRTIANRDSRGIGGHSMGGYGTVRIGMKRPDVFSSMYIMSACCLLNNPRPAAAGQGARGASPAAPASPAPPAATPAAVPAATAPAAPAVAPSPAAGQRGAPSAGAAAAPGAGNRGGGGRGGFTNTASAEAAAWSANPNNAPKFFDEPVKDGQLQPLIVAKWLANSPLAMIDQYVTNLKKYKAIAGEVGLQDTLKASNVQLDQMMSDLGLVHTFETYEGDHTNHVPQRIETRVLPFFSNNLSFTQPK
jgi:enterochelin esterase-like enzyme